MSDEHFVIKKHVVPAAHTRNVQRGVRDEDLMSAGALRLAVNQYIPKRNPKPNQGDFTIIFVHGVQSAKECYEPLFDEIIETMPKNVHLPIRSIWIADMATQCESFLLNEEIIGDQIDLLDCSRDLMQMINHLQAEMPPPLVGMGQSAGFSWLVPVSVWNPRLFSGLVGVEAIVGPTKCMTPGRKLSSYPGVAVANRRDRWESRQKAREELRKRPYYKVFDQRAFDKVIEHELRDDPSYTSSSSSEVPVVLTTPKNLELAQWGQPDPPISNFPLNRAHKVDRNYTGPVPGFYQPGGAEIFDMMEQLNSPLLFIRSKDSLMASDYLEMHITVAGTGVYGSGGVASGQVTRRFVTGGHVASLENPKQVALVLSEWLLELKAELDAAREARKSAPPFLPYGQVHQEIMDRWLKLKL